VSALSTHGRKFESLVVVLGASNVRRSLVPLTRTLLRKIPRPANIVFACGHGRSFGQYNNVLGWSLPGLRDAHWREHCRQTAADNRYVILTDVGNDIFYEHTAEDIIRWVQDCLQSIPNSSSGVIMGLPIARIESLRPVWFEVMRRVFYPSSKVSRLTALKRAGELHRELQKTAFSLGFSWVEPSLDWYAWDPIHIRRYAMATAWESIVDAMIHVENGPSRKFAAPFSNQLEISNRIGMTWRLEQRLKRARALQQRWLGKDRGSVQPWMTLEDGSTLSFY
jgi:hypothetical protein